MPKLLFVLSACTADKPTDSDPRIETSPPKTTLEPTREIDLVDAGEVRCADPSRRLESRYDTTEIPAEAPKRSWMWGAGLMAGDLDGDNLLDLVLPGYWGTVLYLGTTAGGFTNASDRLPDAPLDSASGGALADYDGDGDLDILVTRYLVTGDLVGDRLLRNDAGHFADVTDVAGLAPLGPQLGGGRRSMASSWGDFDRDGDLDLYIGGYGYIDQSGEDPDHDDFNPADPDFLYRNNGDGTFEDISSLLPPEVHDGYAFSGGWFDLDRDGWLDLYVVHDFGRSYPNRLLWNREGVLELDNGAHGLDVQITGMGVGVGDINGDSIEDLVMSAWDGNSAMMSGAGGAGWFESVDILGLQNDLSRYQKIGWGVDLIDMDNDGDLDAPMVYGWLDAEYLSSERQPDAMYENQGDGTFIDVGPEWGLNHPTVGRGYVPIDINRDGWLDLVKRDLAGPTLVHLSRCGEQAWLEVSLRQPGLNPFAVGATVIVHEGKMRQSQVIRAGGTNHASAGPPEVHFGLADLDSIDLIEVIWPDGEVSHASSVGTRRQILLVRSQ